MDSSSEFIEVLDDENSEQFHPILHSTPLKKTRTASLHLNESDILSTNDSILSEEEIEIFDVSDSTDLSLHCEETCSSIEMFDITTTSFEVSESVASDKSLFENQSVSEVRQVDETVSELEITLDHQSPVQNKPVFQDQPQPNESQLDSNSDFEVQLSQQAPEVNQADEIKQKKKHGVKRDDQDILWLLSITCCEKKCMRKFSVEDITLYENEFKNLEQTGRRNYVLNYLHTHTATENRDQYFTEFVVKGRQICKEAWCLIHDIKRESFRRLLNQFKDGVNAIEHGHQGIRRPSEKTKESIAWLKFFISCVGQHQPDKATVHLPSCISIIGMYKEMVEENKEFNKKSVSLSQFYNIFQTEFKHVKIPKENRFTKCTDCKKYKDILLDRSADKSTKNEAKDMLSKHLDNVWRERNVYWLHRYKARRFPDKYLTVIDDAMDQKTTAIPREQRTTKATCNLATVGTHLVGGIFHSGQSPMGKDIFGSFDYYQWSHDPNLTISVLLTMLIKWSEIYKMPPVLYLQLDNCVKENKNQYMMWFLSLLVELKIFDKIKMNFLPVGHTHEDIDAAFGVFSKHLSLNDVYTIEDLLNAMSNCFKTVKAHPYLMEVSYNIKDWLAPNAEQLHDHTIPKCFKFTRDENGHCAMYYRNYSHMNWLGPQQILKTIPDGKPDLILPVLDKVDISGLKKDIKKFEEHYPFYVSQSWEKWLSNVDKLVQLPSDYGNPFMKLMACSKIRPTASSAAIPQQLKELNDREQQATRKIYTGRYMRPEERENPVEDVEDITEQIEVGKFVGVFLSNWDKEPVIGKVTEVKEDTFKLQYWKGTYKGKWSPQNVPRKSVPWLDELPKGCVILCSFSLNENDKLLPTTRKHLQDEYKRLKALT